MPRREPLDLLMRTKPRDYRPHPKRRYKVAFFALAGACVVLAALIGWRLVEYADARRAYAALRDLPEATDAPPPAEAAPPALSAVVSDAPPQGQAFFSGKVKLLTDNNPDTIGWLDIPDTSIQYPVVQGKDNDYYMTRTYEKKKSASGAIFLDCATSPDLSGFNTVIYGHNMKDGSMFNGLRLYDQQSYFDAHSRVILTQLRSKKHYKIFAAYTAQGAQVDFIGYSAVDGESRSAFIKAIRKRSALKSNQVVSRDDKLLTLVTCTSGTHDWYWVVHAVLVETIDTKRM